MLECILRNWGSVERAKVLCPLGLVHPAWHILVREGLSSGHGGFVGPGASAASQCSLPVLLLHLLSACVPFSKSAVTSRIRKLGPVWFLLHWFNHWFYLCLSFSIYQIIVNLHVVPWNAPKLKSDSALVHVLWFLVTVPVTLPWAEPFRNHIKLLEWNFWPCPSLFNKTLWNYPFHLRPLNTWANSSGSQRPGRMLHAEKEVRALWISNLAECYMKAFWQRKLTNSVQKGKWFFSMEGYDKSGIFKW